MQINKKTQVANGKKKRAKNKSQRTKFGICLLFFVLCFLFFKCTDSKPEKLPIIGERLGIASNGDTIYPTVRPFKFVNQDSAWVSDKDFEGKIYVSDFFFTHCPTICPKVTAQMLRVYNAFKDSAEVKLISFSIDPRHDTVGRLKEYASGLNVTAPKWNFVTGTKDTIYALARDYFSIATEDPNVPGGFDHSGRLILVDKKRHVRSFCDGTDAKQVDRFMCDIALLLKEK